MKIYCEELNHAAMVVKSHGLLAENFWSRKASRAVQSDGLRIKGTRCNCQPESSGGWDEMSKVKLWGGKSEQLSPLPPPFLLFRRPMLSRLAAALPWWAVQFALLSSLTLMQISSRNTLTNTVRNNFSFKFYTLGIYPMVSYLLLPSSYRCQLRNLFFFNVVVSSQFYIYIQSSLHIKQTTIPAHVWLIRQEVMYFKSLQAFGRLLEG